MGSSIRHILSDLGGVLVHLRYDRAITLLQPHCAPPDGLDLQSFFQLPRFKTDPAFDAFERGELAPHDFFERVGALLGFNGSYALFVQAWQSIFEPNMPMIELLRNLSRQCTVYCLSNSNVLHVPFIYSAVPELDFFGGDAVSCYLGVAKPDARYYRLALAKFGLQPQTCLFVDDAQENVEGARAIGMQAVHYAGFESASQAMLAAIQPRIQPHE